MKKLIIAMILTMTIGAAAHSFAKAYWTGRVNYITTITYKQGVQCEYEYSGQKFWRTFTGGTCPQSVDVQ